MIAGLPLASWLLIVVAVGAGLVIELAFLRAQRRAAHSRDVRHATQTDADPPATSGEHLS